MKLDKTAGGVFAIAPTPFLEDGAVDYASLDRLTEFYASAGCDGITVLGIMGEAPKLEFHEAFAVAQRVIGRAGRMPIIVGVSAAGFAAMRSLSHRVMDAGAAGVMIAPPPSLRTDEQIVGYFQQAAESIGPGVPWVLQDYPLALTVVMSAEVIGRIVTDNPSCVMLKHEDWPGLDKLSKLRRFQRSGTMRPIAILTGNGGLFLDFELERGADGALVETVRLSKEGRREEAHDLFDAHLPLMRYEQQKDIGLAVRKYLLKRRGILTSDAQRKPWPRLSSESIAEVEYLLTRVSRHDKRATLDTHLMTS
jgi:4-hydroxy-tetrahydrodipicolinate synthase